MEYEWSIHSIYSYVWPKLINKHTYIYIIEALSIILMGYLNLATKNYLI